MRARDEKNTRLAATRHTRLEQDKRGEKKETALSEESPRAQHNTDDTWKGGFAQRCRRWGGEGRKAKQPENGNGSNVMKYQAGGESQSGGPGLDLPT